MDFKKDLFLSKHLDKICYSVVVDSGDLTLPNDCQFAYVKTEINPNYSQLITQLGFYLVDVAVKMRAANYEDLNKQNSNIMFASVEDEDIVKKIAFESFTYDRFHADPNISPHVASTIKKNWVGNYFKGLRGDKCFVCKNDGVVVGFLLALKKNKTAVIDLIAVDKNHRGYGVGKQLIFSMKNHYASEVECFYVGTQLDNRNSIALYESVGFDFYSSNLVWHYHKSE